MPIGEELPPLVHVNGWSFVWIDLELPLRSPLRTGHGTVDVRATRLLSLEGRRGAEWGEAASPFGAEDRRSGADGPGPETGDSEPEAHRLDPSAPKPSRWDAVTVEALEAVGDELPDNPQALVQALDRLAWPPELRPLRAGLETALASLAASAKQLPLWRWLRAADDETTDPWVPVNALLTEGSPEALAQAARDAVTDGYQTLKLKVTGPRLSSTDLARVRAVAKAVSPHVRLRCDANGAWTREAALEALERLAPYRPEYVEQPVPRHPAEDFLEVARRSPVPVAADESVASPADLDGLLIEGGPPVFVVKPAFVGGPATASQMCRRILGANRKAIVTSGLDSAVGRYAALAVAASLKEPRPAAGLATAGLMAWDVHPGPALVSGRIRAPSQPGLGLAYSAVLKALSSRP